MFTPLPLAHSADPLRVDAAPGRGLHPPPAVVPRARRVPLHALCHTCRHEALHAEPRDVTQYGGQPGQPGSQEGQRGRHVVRGGG